MLLDSGFLEFKLEYSKTKDLTFDDSVESENFSVGGHIWRICCWPRGEREEDRGEYLSLFLRLVSKSKKVKAIFDASVMNGDGEPSLSDAKRTVHNYPLERGGDWGWPRFMKRQDVERLYETNGWVTFLCGIVVLSDDSISVPPSEMGIHLGGMLDSMDGTDVSFTIEDETFRVHRAVLAARSPVFRAELFGSMAEATMSSITLHDIAPATFKAMLRFMYTDALPGDNELGDSPVEMFQHLLAVADRYALTRLKFMCAQRLWDNVSVDTVSTTLACAETYNCPELKSKCIDFFAVEKNFKEAVFTDGFGMLLQKFPSITAELRERVKT